MISILALLPISFAFVSAHPPIHAHIHEAIGNLVNELDSRLTSKPMLKITKPLEDLTVEAGDKVTLVCEALHIPSALIYWERNGVRIQGDRELNIKEKMLNRGRQIVESGILASSLSIPCAQVQDSGEYQCVAFNGYSTVKSSAELVVVGQSQCKSARRSPPSISQWTDSRFEMEGNTATLLCRTNEFTDKTWAFEDGTLDLESGRFQIQPNGDLLIKNIQWGDMGTFICTASNEHGEDTVETFLYPTKKKQF